MPCAILPGRQLRIEIELWAPLSLFAPREMSGVLTIEKCRHFPKERRCPRNHSERGLIRLDAQPENSRTMAELRS